MAGGAIATAPAAEAAGTGVALGSGFGGTLAAAIAAADGAAEIFGLALGLGDAPFSFLATFVPLPGGAAGLGAATGFGVSTATADSTRTNAFTGAAVAVGGASPGMATACPAGTDFSR